MKRSKTTEYFLFTALAIFNALTVQAIDADHADTNKNIDMPFIHIGINKHPDGRKDVEVKAPFVHVHNPAGPNNVQVKAPFTKVEHGNSSQVKNSQNSDKKALSTTTSTQNQ